MYFKFDSFIDSTRSIGSWEAISYLFLLIIAMPLKYIWGQPEAVHIGGTVHGILWMAYVGLAFLGQIKGQWPLRTTLWLFIASLLPFGPFLAESRLLAKNGNDRKSS